MNGIAFLTSAVEFRKMQSQGKEMVMSISIEKHGDMLLSPSGKKGEKQKHIYQFAEETVT